MLRSKFKQILEYFLAKMQLWNCCCSVSLPSALQPWLQEGPELCSWRRGWPEENELGAAPNAHCWKLGHFFMCCPRHFPKQSPSPKDQEVILCPGGGQSLLSHPELCSLLQPGWHLVCSGSDPSEPWRDLTGMPSPSGCLGQEKPPLNCSQELRTLPGSWNLSGEHPCSDESCLSTWNVQTHPACHEWELELEQEQWDFLVISIIISSAFCLLATPFPKLFPKSTCATC